MQLIWRTLNRAGGIRRSFLLVASQFQPRLHYSHKQQPIINSNSFSNTQQLLRTPDIIYAQNRYMGKITLQVRQTKKTFFIELEGKKAELRYSVKDGVMVFLHTNVPEELGGRGIGKVLAKVALDFALRNGLFIVIKCKFVQYYIDKYEPQYAKYILR